MNWTDLKIKIEAALPGDIIHIPKGIGSPPLEGINIPKRVTVILSEPLPLFQISEKIDNTKCCEFFHYDTFCIHK